MIKLKAVLKGFFDWFDPSNIMDVYQEWHAFVEGLAEGFCIWACEHEPSEDCLEDIQEEHHYYTAGRAIGFAGFLVLVTGLLVWIIGAIHG